MYMFSVKYIFSPDETVTDWFWQIVDFKIKQFSRWPTLATQPRMNRVIGESNSRLVKR